MMLIVYKRVLFISKRISNFWLPNGKFSSASVGFCGAKGATENELRPGYWVICPITSHLHSLLIKMNNLQ